MEVKDDSYDWNSVDDTTDPANFVNYLDTASAIEFFQLYKRETYFLLNVGEGSSVLDIGCGTGDDVIALAQIVGSNGRVVGIDSSETMIAEARKKAEGAVSRIEFQVKDAHNLDFGDNTFDGCRADRVFQHLEGPEQALSEIIRVARPGSRIVIIDPDWETLVVDMPNKSLTRKILNYFCDEAKNGWCGRELYRFFKTAGLKNISIHPRTLTLTDFEISDQLFSLRQTAEKMQNANELTAAESAEWLDCLHRSRETGHFFAAVTGFMAVGCKP